MGLVMDSGMDFMTWDFWNENSDAIRSVVWVVATFVGILVLIVRGAVAGAAVSQAKTAHRGNVSDRFSTAITNLRHKEGPVRLGAVHTLERISEESERSHWSIMDNLAAHVRRERPRVKYGYKEPLDLDVQEALRVLGSRSKFFRKRDQEKGWALDLSGADLTGADLQNVNFDGSNFRGAVLRKCDLRGASLKRADLSGAILEGVNVKGGDLSEANLREADIRFANLREACFDGANLWCAKLEASSLGGAKLNYALLWKADLRGASTVGVQLKGALLGEANLVWATVRLSDFEGACGLGAIGWPAKKSKSSNEAACA